MGLAVPGPWSLGAAHPLPRSGALLSCSLELQLCSASPSHQAGQKQSVCAGSVLPSHFFPAELAGCAAPLGAHSDIACSPDEDRGTSHLHPTDQIVALLFDLLLLPKQHRMLLHVSQFPGEMWAGNCITAVEDSCVTLLAADDALYPHMK